MEAYSLLQHLSCWCYKNTMNKIESELTVDRKLSEIFEEAFDLFNSFETCNDPTNSPEFQVIYAYIFIVLNFT